MKKKISNGMKKQIAETIAIHRKMLDELEGDGIDTIKAAAKTIIDCIAEGGIIYTCGNGGSAADAQHIAAELVGRFLKDRKSLPVIALTTNTSVITAVANDYNFEDIFAKQVEALVKKPDCLWALSTSGNSGNVISAAELAKKRGAKVIAFTGKANSRLEEIADICLCVPHDKSFVVQEMHQIAYHIICGLIEQHFTGVK